MQIDVRQIRQVARIVSNKEKPNKHFPLFVHDNPFRRISENPEECSQYVKKGQTAADLGCGPSYFTISLAEQVGAEGRVYAVDSDEKAIKTLEKKADKHGLHNIETHKSSASDLDFIQNDSVDFILVHGLLCSMAPKQCDSAVQEIKRVLKREELAYLTVAKGFYSYVDKDKWETILEQFKVKQRGGESFFTSDRWALISKK